jgi:hypothetical protein
MGDEAGPERPGGLVQRAKATAKQAKASAVQAKANIKADIKAGAGVVRESLSEQPRYGLPMLLSVCVCVCVCWPAANQQLLPFCRRRSVAAAIGAVESKVVALKTQAVDTAVAWSERKVIAAVGMAVDKCGARVQQGVKQDPTLPKFVAQLVCDIVAGLLPDIKEEAVYALVGAVYNPAESALEVEARQPRGVCGRLCGCVRGLVLYHWLPFDRGGWRKLADPLWWLLLLFALCPVLGIQQMFHVRRAPLIHIVVVDVAVCCGEACTPGYHSRLWAARWALLPAAGADLPADRQARRVPAVPVHPGLQGPTSLHHWLCRLHRRRRSLCVGLLTCLCLPGGPPACLLAPAVVGRVVDALWAARCRVSGGSDPPRGSAPTTRHCRCLLRQPDACLQLPRGVRRPLCPVWRPFRLRFTYVASVLVKK